MSCMEIDLTSFFSPPPQQRKHHTKIFHLHTGSRQSYLHITAYRPKEKCNIYISHSNVLHRILRHCGCAKFPHPPPPGLGTFCTSCNALHCYLWGRVLQRKLHVCLSSHICCYTYDDISQAQSVSEATRILYSR